MIYESIACRPNPFGHRITTHDAHTHLHTHIHTCTHTHLHTHTYTHLHRHPELGLALMDPVPKDMGELRFALLARGEGK